MRCLCLAVFLFFSSAMVLAEPANSDFYAGSVAVADRSVANMREGLRQILLNVLNKVSGVDVAIIKEKPSLTQDLADGDQLASQFVYYYRKSLDMNGQEQKQLRIKANFPEKPIMQLLQKGHLNFWAPGRPALVFWPIFQKAGGVYWLDSNSLYQKQLQQELGDAILQWGFEVQTQHGSMISASHLWQQDASYQQAVLDKVGANILLGRIDSLEGTVTGSVSLLGLGQNTGQLIQADTIGQWADKAVDWAAAQLAERYAVPLRANDSEVVLFVDGVKDYQAYQALLDYVKAIDFVSNVYVLGVQSGEIKLAVRIQTDSEQLQQRLISGHQLSALDNRESAYYQLYLHWNGK